MQVKITISQVSNSLGDTKPIYEDTCDRLQKAYMKMDNLKSYWGGNLYNIIKKNWNGQVEELNNFIRLMKESYNATSHALREFTKADNNEINKGEVSEIKLNPIDQSDSDVLRATVETLRADKQDIVSNLMAAKDGIERIYTNLTTVEASSPAIDELKSAMSRAKTNIVNNLESVRNDIEKNMETAATNYEAAERSIQ